MIEQLSAVSDVSRVFGPFGIYSLLFTGSFRRFTQNKSYSLILQTSGLSKKLVRKLERRIVHDAELAPSSAELRRLSDACRARIEVKAQKYKVCSCLNPIGVRCEHGLCKKCCKQECAEARKNCEGHQFWFGDKNGLRQMMQERKRAQAVQQKLGRGGE